MGGREGKREGEGGRVREEGREREKIHFVFPYLLIFDQPNNLICGLKK